MHKSFIKVKVCHMFYLKYSSQIFFILYFRMKTYNANLVQFHERGPNIKGFSIIRRDQLNVAYQQWFH